MAILTKYNIIQGSPEELISTNRLTEQDRPLIGTRSIDTAFNQSKHRLDTYFYSLDGRLLSSVVDSKNYKAVQGGAQEGQQIVDIRLDPEKDSIQAGYENGDVNVLYNFLNALYSDTNSRPTFYIESISPDRREIRALTNDVTSEDIIFFTQELRKRLEEQPYFEDFRLNFGQNRLLIGINIDTIQYKGDQAVLIRLYEPLPANIAVKGTFLIEELVGDSVLYEISTQVSRTVEDTTQKLRGPNYDIELVEENNNPTGYLNFNELFTYPVTNSYYEVYSLFNEKGAQISIDHTDFSEFIQFSSAEERIRNFYYKASLLEDYRNQIDERAGYTASLEDNIKNIVNNFDHYDRFLYYESGSWSWPKSNSTRPYQLHSTGSTEVLNWYSSIIQSASNYDSENLDRLTNSIPSFIAEDSNNAPYLLFVDMIGQHYDNIWIYSKAVTDKYDADNRLEYGISKDLVRDAIENFGIKLYNNNEALENLFAAFTGEAYSTGSESTVTSLIVAVEGSGSLSGSAGNEHLQPVPKSSYQKEIYKRIYHNIPLLLKSKGTERGLRALINSYGIPSDYLDIKTFGGGEIGTSTFYGPETLVTSSLGKIRISNTDSIVTGSTLSNYTSVINPGKDYSIDLHTVEVGFSPSEYINNYIKTHPSMSSFNLDEYIGDPGLIYSSSYKDLSSLAETVFTSGSSYAPPLNAFEFVRIVKFFDNSLFRMVKEFVPARSNVSTGVIIKPHLLNRSKIKQPQVGWSNQTSQGFLHSSTQLDYTGSYYSTNFSIDGEINTAFTTGSTGLGLVDSGSYSYTETYANPSGGYQTLTTNYHDQSAYTGELSGTVLQTTNGDLTTSNTFRKLEPEQFSFKYIPRNDFTSPANVFLDNTPSSYTADVSASLDSPNQGSDNLVFNSDTLDIGGTNPYTFNFNLDGGPNAGNGVEDSGSLFISPAFSIAPGEAVIVNITATFTNLSRFNVSNADDNDKPKLVIELVAGNTVRDSVTLTRSTLSSYTETTSIKFENGTATTFTQDGGNFTGATGQHFRIRYSSNYETPDTVTDLTDVQVLASFTKTYYNSDAITLWISENPSSITESGYTSSIVEAMTVPLSSPTNGTMLPYLREAKEVVFEYPGFITTPQYDKDSVTTSVQGGSYKANITLVDNDIELVHVTSAPYSASFTQDIPTLADGESIDFEFNIDFDSYATSYLPYPADPSLTPFVTASIRDKTTSTVLGGLEIKSKQGEFPQNTQYSLKYENSTGGNITNKEFYYQVNIPSSTGAGNPIVNLRNIKIDYRQDTTIFNKGNVLSTKKLQDIFYIDIDPNVEVSSGSLDYFTPTTDYYKVGFLTGESELFKFNDYAATSNNVDSLRRSNTRLVVDEKTYTPTQGTYRNFFLPSNYSVLSESINNGVEGLDEKFFAEVQDSNYYATGWRNGRYDGTEATNLVGGFAVLGKEPALTFETFKASLFDNTSTATEIKTKFSGSETKEGDLEVYYNTYTLQGEETLTLSNVSSVETNGTAGTVNSTTYEVDISNAAIGSGTYSGSIGNLNKNDRINIDFSVLIENSIDLDISSITVNIKEPGNTVPIVNQSYNGAEFVLDSTVSKVFTFNSIPRNISNGILEFSFTNIEDDEGGSPNFTLTVNSIKKVSLQPFASSQDNIVTSTSSGRTIFYNKQLPTPSSPSGYIPVINSKIYRFSNNTVYTTNDKGIVTNIE